MNAFMIKFVNYGTLFDPDVVQQDPSVVHRTKDPVNASDKISVWTSEYHRGLDRIVIARNPYIRFLSSYLDWAARNHNKNKVTFDEFAIMYEARNLSKQWRTLYDHIDPISENCGMDRLNYSQVYHIEEMPLWYQDLIDRYELQDLMDQYTAHGNSLFDAALDASALVSEYTSSIVGARPWPGKNVHLQHYRIKDEFVTMAKQYYTPRIAKIVTRLFHKDFVQLQYPLWDGNPSRFRYT
jgi:hypothetical protein